MKFNRDVSFYNMEKHPSGLQISMPPLSSQYDMPQKLKEEHADIPPRIYGGGVDASRLEAHRICW